MNHRPTVSVVINNYNYGRFLGEAIDSVLAQEHACHELVVVDDGSTDHSRQVIESYGDQLIAVFKENGGQASALNAGYRPTTGDVVIFLDADDVLLPQAVSRVSEAFRDGRLSKVHWRPEVVGAAGARADHRADHGPLQSGDLRSRVIAQGAAAVSSPPMSCNAFSRRFLAQSMPIPESLFRLCADEYLFTLAPVFGTIGRVDEILTLYRFHGANHYCSVPLQDRVRAEAVLQLQINDILRDTLERQGVQVESESWPPPWGVAQVTVLETIAQVVPHNGIAILVDQEQWGAGETIAGRTRVPFTEHNGEYWGVPANDRHAVSELERLRGQGAGAIVFIPSTFWWLEHYPAFARHLVDTYHCVVADENVKIFDLRQPKA